MSDEAFNEAIHQADMTLALLKEERLSNTVLSARLKALDKYRLSEELLTDAERVRVANHLNAGIQEFPDHLQLRANHILYGEGSPSQDPEPSAWPILTLLDAYKPREPNEYAIQGLIKARSLSIVYGPPGTLKSLLLVDATICVVAGKEWLSAIPGQVGGDGRPTKQAPILWCDFDNGADMMHERIEAISRAHDVSRDAPFNYVVMPKTWLDASDYNSPSFIELRVAVQKTDAKMLVIDCLSLVAGSVDENSAEMAQVMSSFRQLAERANIAVILIHHQRKSSGIKTRAGDTLRGHSSIEAALDLALLVERENQSEKVVLKATKVRGADIFPFGAMFAYEHKPGTEKELYSARFFGVDVEDTTSDRAIREKIIEVIDRPINKGDLTTLVKAHLPDIGLNRIRDAIEWLAHEGKLKVKKGARGEKTFSPTN